MLFVRFSLTYQVEMWEKSVSVFLLFSGHCDQKLNRLWWWWWWQMMGILKEAKRKVSQCLNNSHYIHYLSNLPAILYCLYYPSQWSLVLIHLQLVTMASLVCTKHVGRPTCFKYTVMLSLFSYILFFVFALMAKRRSDVICCRLRQIPAAVKKWLARGVCHFSTPKALHCTKSSPALKKSLWTVKKESEHLCSLHADLLKLRCIRWQTLNHGRGNTAEAKEIHLIQVCRAASYDDDLSSLSSAF